MPSHRAERKKRHPLLPSTPSLVGVAVLAVAGVGAVTVGERALPAPAASSAVQTLAAPASAATGTDRHDAVGGVTRRALTDRDLAISRDSRREALEEAADERLQAAAERRAKERTAALEHLAVSAEERSEEIEANRWVLPVASYQLTARFGESSGLWSSTHTGLDFAAPSGTPIHAVASGVVKSTGYSGAYGNRTIVTLDDGTQIWYCHQTSYAVSPGDQVSAGEVIGTVGSTGNSTGSHLHLEVRPSPNQPVDPYAALVEHGLKP